ncbi:hypothetical protein ABFO19_06070 [Xanthomonas citri pv. glycines]|uniref:hypothetical protein n=1 Tax=Xanthomonas TaxID=338 RepID=UPI000F5A58A2|nr:MULTISPECIES: hypothetical protein [Xanthomonas]QDR44365.1 hypothetical protein FPK90_06395 [Xanthomonas citri pv. glycines]QDS10835.1 hypothetical protein FPL03_06385 [Xanthomonas citri pv. glycines]QDS19505.1 hypothetical protein FPL05_06810 [Xanthomonas citri pv. glycines]QTK35773.1 hypothetical protein XcgCFBP2526_06050 [Xanthomonas citri pv. glycines CFBP 2526]QTK40287.1 hypothetical protein XcgCFBP7119R_06315 [Xanthomonas citri pv. glycines]
MADWSDIFQRMLDTCPTFRAAQPGVVIGRIESVRAAPGAWSPESIPDMFYVSAMLEVMRAQVAAFNLIDPQAPIGGRAVSYEISPSGVNKNVAATRLG